MAYSCKILADSLGPTGDRLTTFELIYPRFIHSEFLTHRVLSRNSASSRAIPISVMIKNIEADPASPVWWGKNQSGMQAREELPFDLKILAKEEWRIAGENAISSAKRMEKIGAHKQISNRIVEPWMWITVIASGTEWDNFFYLRCHEDAQPEIKYIADMMRIEYDANSPKELIPGSWHMPFISDEDWHDTRIMAATGRSEFATQIECENLLCKVAVGRCARVSYLTHFGTRDLYKDVQLCDQLASNGHWSPFEHVAMAVDKYDELQKQGIRAAIYELEKYGIDVPIDLLEYRRHYGNFYGFKPYRKFFENEHYGKRML